jgi:hypothetical protein
VPSATARPEGVDGTSDNDLNTRTSGILRYPGAPGIFPSRWTVGRRMNLRQLTRRRGEIVGSPSKL